MTETVCNCQPTIVSPTPSMIARGFTEWLHHSSSCAVTVERQQPIIVEPLLPAEMWNEATVTAPNVVIVDFGAGS